MENVKDIVFKDCWYNDFYDETEIYFEAPKSYLNGKYHEADGCIFELIYPGFALIYPSTEWDIDDATIWISPFKDDGGTRSDYDWYPYVCEPEFKQTLIYKKRGYTDGIPDDL